MSKGRNKARVGVLEPRNSEGRHYRKSQTEPLQSRCLQNSEEYVYGVGIPLSGTRHCLLTGSGIMGQRKTFADWTLLVKACRSNSWTETGANCLLDSALCPLLQALQFPGLLSSEGRTEQPCFFKKISQSYGIHLENSPEFKEGLPPPKTAWLKR